MLEIDKDKLLLSMANKCLTTEALKKESGVGRVTISRLLNGKKSKVQAHIVGKLARTLEITVAELLVVK